MSLGTIAWQQPYLNTFKYFGISSDKSVIKQGEISCVMDSQIKCTVFKITGATPSNNFINIPKSSTNSLGLTGRYFYLLFKPVPNKYFSIHIDITTHEGVLLRVSFSNLFKEFKTTSTWLQFPYVIQAPKGSVYEKLENTAKDLSGSAPPITKWTILCVDLINLTQIYANRTFHYIRSFKICANVLVKNVITSDLLYEPGITHAEARLKGVYAFPRELSYPFEKYENWYAIYDYVCFPSESFKKPFDSVGQSRVMASLSALSENFESGTTKQVSPKRMSTRQVNTQVATLNSIPAIDILTKPKHILKNKNFQIQNNLPIVGIHHTATVEMTSKKQHNGDIHVYPCMPSDLKEFKDDSNDLQSANRETFKTCKTFLEPDPILKLHKVIGFGGSTYSSILWTNDSQYLLYPCNAILICYHIDSGTQWSYIGHTDKISCLTMDQTSTVIVSGQTGQHSFVRFWDFHNRNCLAVCKNHDANLCALEFSYNSEVLCGIGKDKYGKSQIILWDTKDVRTKNTVKILAKASTDVHIKSLQFVPYDNTRLVSCGRDNIRFWRVKDSSIRSCPINLSAYMHKTDEINLDFTDIRFDTCFTSVTSTNGNTLYACTKAGHIFELDYARMDIKNVRVLQSNETIDVSESAPIPLNTLSISDSFCATGSDDGILRVWPLDFKQVCMEAEHDSPIAYVAFSPDYMYVVTATSNGNLGILNILHKDYRTIIRSHTDTICDAAIDPMHRYIVTTSNDMTIRIWDFDTCKQLYDYKAPDERPTRLCYHPFGIENEQIFACGFSTGKIRIFNVLKAKLLYEIISPYAKPNFTVFEITDLMYSKDGKCLISGDASGVLYLYNTDRSYCLVRCLPNSLSVFGSLCTSEDGKYSAAIGSIDTLITVYETTSLNEILRIDISVCGGSGRDTAARIAFAPYELNQIICATNTNKLLKFDARNGKLLSSLSNIHRQSTDCMMVSNDCQFLITTGDNQIKIWDYQMRLDCNYQIFIGHSTPIYKVLFTPDNSTLITIGDGLYFWDFLAYKNETSVEMPQGRELNVKIVREDQSDVLNKLLLLGDRPRTPPVPFNYVSENLTTDQINDTYLGSNEATDDQWSVKKYDSLPNLLGSHNDLSIGDSGEGEAENADDDEETSNEIIYNDIDDDYIKTTSRSIGLHRPYAESQPPYSVKHLSARVKRTRLAKRFYSAPPGKCALQFNSSIGYNGAYSTGNMLWNPENGFFAYSIGALIIIEDLKTGQQTPLKAHNSDITVLALQYDCIYMASASAQQDNEQIQIPNCQIIIWDTQNLTRKKTLTHKNAFHVNSLCYSRDDRFLISVSDYRRVSLIVWNTYDYTVSASIDRIVNAIHDVTWDSTVCNTFVTCGQRKTLNFWTLDEKQNSNTVLKIHECEIPFVLNEIHNTDEYEFSCLSYGLEKLLFAATTHGFITVWDTITNTCLLYWQADTNEIVSMSCMKSELVTGSSNGSLKLWTVSPIYDHKRNTSSSRVMASKMDGLTIQNELLLNGVIKCFKFDKSLDIGIVATNKGTLWYVNWLDSSMIRLINTHSSRITCVASVNERLISTCSEDGTLRIWSMEDREQIAQFEVKTAALCQSLLHCDNKLFQLITTYARGKEQNPLVVVGYSDGSVRVFDIDKISIVTKMQPFASDVTAIEACSNSAIVVAGSKDGLLAILNLRQSITMRILHDHRGVPITSIHSIMYNNSQITYWAAASRDRRVSVWESLWLEDKCEMIDWLTFSAPKLVTKRDESKVLTWSSYPPCLLQFTTSSNSNTLVYVGYGAKRQIAFYNFIEKKILRTLPLSEWPYAMCLSPNSNLIAFGTKSRLLQLKDTNEGAFQDYLYHSDDVSSVCFSSDGKRLFSASFNEILCWNVNV